ncbi:MAG: S46 family peptidase, partial [Holophagae bacterium]|nr:S46 family peptidase [Holophagae bacterium]
ARIRFRERGYDKDIDPVYMKFLLKKMCEKPVEQWPRAVSDVLKKGDAAIDKYVDELYANTIMGDPVRRLEMLNLTPEALSRNPDMLLKLAAELEVELKELRDKSRALGQEHQDLKKMVVKGMMEQKVGRLAPDANSTIRFTSGNVMGYSVKDGVRYLPFTTLNGVMEKETGKFPFVVPEKLKTLYKNRDFGRYEDTELQDVVTCFLNTTNVTGGNSGSPVLDADGRQVGIVFDMTYESVVGDYLVLPELQRTIHVDIRYVLFVTEKFGGATRILKEMGL